MLDVRDAVADFDDTHVGGGDAEALDAEEYAASDRQLILPLILLLVLGALLLLLRSIVAPLLLVATVVATYAAAMGASWWLFQTVFGFEAMDTGVPLLAFLFLVALGVDYNIFLVTRAREEAREHGTRTGMLRALTATGGVITSAGILLAAVFAVLGVLPLVVLAQLGAIIFVGVLLDTLVVRTVLVPALALTLGDTFWWPRKVGPSGARRGSGSALAAADRRRATRFVTSGWNTLGMMNAACSSSALTVSAIAWAARSSMSIGHLGGAGVEEAAEDAGEGQHVVDLVGVVGAARGHHGGVLVGLGRVDLRVGVGEGEDDRLGRHGRDPLGVEDARCGHADEDVGVDEHLAQRPGRPARVGGGGQLGVGRGQRRRRRPTSAPSRSTTTTSLRRPRRAAA